MRFENGALAAMHLIATQKRRKGTEKGDGFIFELKINPFPLFQALIGPLARAG